VYETNIIQKRYVSTFYKKEIKNHYDWLIFVDVDEFIVTKRNIGKTIRDELLTTFKNVDHIRIPWVMMACNGLEKNPKSLLKENVYRMNHDIRHNTDVPLKFRCRYDMIEVKSIFKTKYFDDFVDHCPINCNKKNPVILNSINLTDDISNTNINKIFYKNLREHKINSGFLLCYHYRIISKENCQHKLNTNKWYIDKQFTLSNLMDADYPEIIDETMRIKSIPSSPIVKNIYILWLQGFKNAPKIVRMCLNSWIRYNPDWNIIKLDASNIKEYVNLNAYKEEILNEMPIFAFSNIIQIELLNKFGGLWINASTLCMRPLNCWLPHYIKQGFFAFEKPKKNVLISPWFIYSGLNNYITQNWVNETVNFWNNQNVNRQDFWEDYKLDKHNYCWFNNLFNNLYNSDAKFAERWNNVPKYSAKTCKYFHKHGVLNDIDPTIKKYIDNNLGTVQKLSHKVEHEHLKPSSLLKYIFYTNELKFIHIPKTGGSSIETASIAKNIYWGKNDTSLKRDQNAITWHCPQNDKRLFFCVIRCPYERIISEFYHENKIIDYNANDLNNWIKMSLKKFDENNNYKDNHFMQQIHFAKCCNIQISIENLNDNLCTILNKFEMPNLILDNLSGGPVQIEKRSKKSFNRLNINDIDSNNINLINKIYSNDIELWREIKSVGIKWGCNI
jgi:hypothetical protein